MSEQGTIEATPALPGRRPVILIVSAEHADFLLDEFGRYARDYDVRAVRSAARWRGV